MPPRGYASAGVRAYWFNVHKSIGISLGVLVLVRIAWRRVSITLPCTRGIAVRITDIAVGERPWGVVIR